MIRQDVGCKGSYIARGIHGGIIQNAENKSKFLGMVADSRMRGNDEDDV